MHADRGEVAAGAHASTAFADATTDASIHVGTRCAGEVGTGVEAADLIEDTPGPRGSFAGYGCLTHHITSTTTRTGEPRPLAARLA